MSLWSGWPRGDQADPPSGVSWEPGSGTLRALGQHSLQVGRAAAQRAVFELCLGQLSTEVSSWKAWMTKRDESRVRKGDVTGDPGGLEVRPR